MGVSFSWIAINGRSPQEIHAAIGARATGGREEFYRSNLTATELPHGFYLVIFKKEELSSAKLRKYSTAFDLLYGFVEEHVMYSAVAAWSNGEEVWSVAHDAQEGVFHLKVKGSPPAGFVAIRDRLIAEQNGEDPANPEVDHVFDIPVELGRELTGYRHDQDVQNVKAGAFEVLEPIGKSGFRGWNPFKK
jgi:hypothetical protein